ncbi:peptidyl-tRNA hydrolase-like protein [Leptotrombidium deliense]|uniref:Large ribosomal subunit protein mL62 n=1 Tax=Leptotrombidium deliense TaxID=299467 RepID=A0A443SMJ3_9ACAR|nr:peptidyl-tRNA hydrolase-like protein [Leptotrombidium deliense]
MTLILRNDIIVKVARSGKPGGQHVNKINSKVCISLHLSSANWIPSKTKEKLITIHRNSITKDGYWMIRSEKTREQKLNLADCLDKMRCYITEADKPIPEISEESLERKRLQAEKASERRLRDKRHRSMLKLAKADF